MPALVTHDFFGRDVYARNASSIGARTDEVDAFLLGNQGPDVLFYAMALPFKGDARKLGQALHASAGWRQIAAFKRVLASVPARDRPVAQAYALGYACHFALDSRMHPFVYAWQHAVCEAGIPGVTSRDGSEVHAVIEAELDESMLFARTGMTIAEFNPAEHILQASPHAAKVISALYPPMARESGVADDVPDVLFSAGLRCIRLAQRLLHSPGGAKRAFFSGAESLVRPHSFYRAMCLRPIASATCPYDNRDHSPWNDPFSGRVSTQSFQDLYDEAQKHADALIAAFLEDGFDEGRAEELAGSVNFSGAAVAV